MASIQKRPDGRWRARYRDAANKEHARHFQRKVDAQKWLDGVTASVVRGDYVDPRAGRALVSKAAMGWVAANTAWKASTRARNESILGTHVLPRWGNVQLARVEPNDVQEWINDLTASGLSPRTVRKVFFVFNGVMKHAVSPMKSLSAPPTAGVKLPDPGATGDDENDVDAALSTARRYLSAVEVEKLADAAGPGRLAVLTLAYTGLRWGELAALRVRNFDELRSRLRVERSVTEVNGRLVWTTPKDKEARTVPVPAFLRSELAELANGRAGDAYLFTAPQGGVLRIRAARRGWFDPAVEEVGLDGFTPHALRHTAASLAVHAGANVLAVKRMLGHKKASMTLDVYSDLFDGDLDEVAGRLDGVRTSALADFLRTEAPDNTLRAV